MRVSEIEADIARAVISIVAGALADVARGHSQSDAFERAEREARKRAARIAFLHAADAITRAKAR